MKKLIAFTLAEVLVTLGIIGVVSAMTIPTLMRNHQKTVYVNQLKKVYSLMAQAADSALQRENVPTLDESRFQRSNPNGAEEFLTTYLRVANNCGQNLTPCFGEQYKTMDGNIYTQWYMGTSGKVKSAVTLVDGSAVAVANNAWGYREYESGYVEHGWLIMYVDVNGQAGPNVLGRDLFYLELYSDGKVGDSYSGTGNSWKCQENDGMNYGTGCLSKIIEDGWKMDY